MLQELRTLTHSGVTAAKVTATSVPGDEHVSAGRCLATWWVQKTPGTTYWRTTIPARHLPGQALHLTWSDLKEGPDGEVIVPRQRGSTAVWQFVGNATRALIMAHQQEQGVKVLMELDDNYLRPPPPLPGVRRDWGSKLDRTPEDRYSFQAHAKIVRWVDGVVVATEELATRYERATKAPIYHCPNSADLEDWPEIVERDGPRAIGFAGSASHRYDLALVERALDWAWRQEVELWKIGAATVEWSFPHRTMPWTDDLAEYRRNLQVLDVGLCPLRRGEWEDCKSDIKAIEYVLSGAVPIVQKAPPYRDWFEIVPACETKKEWLKAVKWACQAPAEELQEVWERAHAFLLERKLIPQHIGKWRAAVA